MLQRRSVTCDDPTVPCVKSILAPASLEVAPRQSTNIETKVASAQSVLSTECSGYNKFNLFCLPQTWSKIKHI